MFTSFEVPGESDTTVRTVHEVGHPARTVVNHVVVGSHGREGVSRLLLGSVAERVVRCSTVPERRPTAKREREPEVNA